MRLSRKIQLWLADRNPAFDRPSLYRRPPVLAAAKPASRVWDTILLVMIGMPLIGFGLLGLAFALLAFLAIVSSWL